MNKRMQTLARQSGLPAPGDPITPVSPKAVRRFLKLIIQECTGLIEKDIEPELDGSDYAEHWNMALRSASNEIQKLLELNYEPEN